MSFAADLTKVLSIKRTTHLHRHRHKWSRLNTWGITLGSRTIRTLTGLIKDGVITQTCLGETIKMCCSPNRATRHKRRRWIWKMQWHNWRIRGKHYAWWCGRTCRVKIIVQLLLLDLLILSHHERICNWIWGWGRGRTRRVRRNFTMVLQSYCESR